MDKENKKKTKWIVIFCVIAVFVFCLLFFRVQKVSVEGNTYYSQSVMSEMFQKNIFEKNLLSFWIMDKLSLTPKLEFVREYEVSYPSPNEVHVKLYEKKIVAGISYNNQYIYFDKDGMVLKSTSKSVSDIPLFETKTMTTFTMYEKVQLENDELLSQILNLANLFSHYQIKWDKVEMNEKDEAVLYSGKVKVLLGKKDNYDEQVSALASILETAKKQGGSGEIDMRNYKVKDDIIFKKSEVYSK